MAYTLTTEQQRLVLRLHKLGWDWKQIARAAGCSLDAARWVRPSEQRRPMDWTPGPGRLSAADREEITIGLASGENLSCIARRISKSPSCVSREVAANGGRDGYRGWAGSFPRAWEWARRPKKARSCRILADRSAWWRIWLGVNGGHPMRFRLSLAASPPPTIR